MVPNNAKKLTTVSLLLLMCGYASLVYAAPATTIPRQNNISATLHNLSASGSTSAKATTESQICAFCHTPHAGNMDADAAAINAPLWNRAVTGGTDSTYIEYSSSSIQANIDANPGGPSKLCLSCHDGTLALGNLNVINGQTNQTITMGSTTMPDGSGALTGFTRNLGQDLTGDHPISFQFDTALLAADVELTKPSQTVSDKKYAPLDLNKVQCTTCHDPHISGIDAPVGTVAPTESNIKFLRTRRFQMASPAGGVFDKQNDIVCLACHDKLGTQWSDSIHANPAVADEVYKSAASNQREFPSGIKVWQASCLNCHDTHTAQGANRLLREGTDSIASPKSGGNPALEETCFQCHTNNTDSILTTGIANIETEFSTGYRMPLDRYNANEEVHDIQNADFTEGDTGAAGANDPNNAALGYGNLNNRHAECTDCHNPHRMSRNSLADKSAGNVTSQGTHNHTATHSNKISGVLSGTWGVEPTAYSSNAFGALPGSFIVKSGVGANKVEFEYQICMKCHSNYAYADDGDPESATRPALGGVGLTPKSATAKDNTNFNYYTNQAMEFQAPTQHACEGNCAAGTAVDGGAAVGGSTNHRSWHPVMAKTNRTSAMRGGGEFLAPWTNVGSQTMYCSDCHGASNGTAANSVPSATKPWGPHGSTNEFILRGKMSRGAGRVDGSATLCFKCHDQSTYLGTNENTSGFSGGVGNNGHFLHNADGKGYDNDLLCTHCHVAVVHGWKNKALLVNLFDIGPEAICRDIDNTYYNISPACTPGQPIAAGSSIGRQLGSAGSDGNIGYNNPPYYVNARLRINSWPSSGNWDEGNCFDKAYMDDTMCEKGAAAY